MVVGVQRLFAFSGEAALSHRRNEDGYVQLVRRHEKRVTGINCRRGGAWKGKKDRACTGVYEVLGFFALRTSAIYQYNFWVEGGITLFHHLKQRFVPIFHEILHPMLLFLILF